MKYQQITIHTAPEGVEAVSNVLIALGVGGFEVSDSRDFEEFLQSTTPHWDYVDDSLLSLRTAESVIRIYLPENEQGSDSIEMIQNAMRELAESDTEHLYGSLAVNGTERDDSEWTDTWKQYYKPIEISDRLAVVPEWEDFTPKAGQKVLWMDPGAAFGTGSHETTAMCLSFLSEMDLNGKQILDVGCGSGILGIAALLLGADSDIGVDIDELAVKAGGENAERNGVAAKAHFVAGDLVEKVNGKYDVVCANIVADVLKMLLPQIGDFMKDDGVVLLSGIIDERTAELEEAVRDNGFAVLEKAQKGGWSALKCGKANR